jgi:hypothetical protein
MRTETAASLDERRQHLGPAQSEGAALGTRARRHLRRDEGEPERAGVRQHVPGVGD